VRVAAVALIAGLVLGVAACGGSGGGGQPAGSIKVTMTGFHGAHVAGGLIFLTLMLGRGLKGQFNARHHVGFAAATLYWHFVDVVWIFLFGILYLAVTAV